MKRAEFTHVLYISRQHVFHSDTFRRRERERERKGERERGREKDRERERERKRFVESLKARYKLFVFTLPWAIAPTTNATGWSLGMRCLGCRHGSALYDITERSRGKTCSCHAMRGEGQSDHETRGCRGGSHVEIWVQVHTMETIIFQDYTLNNHRVFKPFSY